MTELPTRPPMPPCPGFERHDFAGHVLCRRPQCRRPRRHWRDYHYGHNPNLKALLCRWLKGELDDFELSRHLLNEYREASAADELVRAWKITRDGLDLPAPVFVSLWEGEGMLRLGLTGTNQAATPRPHSLFALDVLALTAGEGPDSRPVLPSYPIEPGWPHGMAQVAEWRGECGPRLTGEPGRAACRYLGIDSPPRWLTTTQAATKLGYARSHITHLIRLGALPAQKFGTAHQVDPLAVAWRAAQRKEVTH